MNKCGLLGKSLSHSYSPIIHENFRDFYSYDFYEYGEDSLGDFIRLFSESDVSGLNVTIPYKETVIPYLDKLSETAREAGSVNTIVKIPSDACENESTGFNGSTGCITKESDVLRHERDYILYGDNTDVYGFTKMTGHLGVDVAGRKALVLGSGGASKTIVYALREMDARPIVISRTGEDNYENLDKHADAEIIVNATPVGTNPDFDSSPVDLSKFPKCIAVLDLIYNPARTKLLLQANELGIPYENGLYMLVAQAVKSAKLFKASCRNGDELSSAFSKQAKDSEHVTNIFCSEKADDDKVIDDIYKKLKSRITNISFIGMPGCGKSSIGKAFSKATGRVFVDTDEEVFARTGRVPADIIIEDGEASFRDVETEVLAEACKKSSAVIATGGGVVTRDRNYQLLHQNSIIVWINLDLSLLERGGRPISDTVGVEKIYAERKSLYERFADITIDIKADDELVSLPYEKAIEGISERIKFELENYIACHIS